MFELDMILHLDILLEMLTQRDLQAQRLDVVPQPLFKNQLEL